MTLRSAVLILANILYNGIQCNAEQTDNNNSTKDADLDYYEFRLKHGDPLNYEEFIKKVMGKNKSTTEDLYGTAWEDFTDQTHLLVDVPFEEVAFNRTTTRGLRNFWNIPAGAKMMTFLGPNETSTRHPRWDGFTERDLTDITYITWTFASEKAFMEQLTRVRNHTKFPRSTRSPVEDMHNTEDEMILNVNETWLKPYVNKSSSEEEKFKCFEDFMEYTISSTPAPSSTWNPFLVQSEERIELDRIAKEKRMIHNNAMREQVKNNPFGGLGGLFGGLGGLGGVIPVNLGGLMGGLRTITIIMGGGSTRPTSKGISTTLRSTISPKTFRPRPDPKDFMMWKYLDDGSRRPPMSEDEFVRVIRKYSTPFPYHVPSVSIPAHIGEDLLDLLPDENTTIPLVVEPAQLDRIHNFINPFIQQHTAMDLLNVDANAARFTAPSTGKQETRASTTATTTTPTTTTTRRTAQTRLFTTEPEGQSHKPTEEWRASWSRTYNTIDPFNKDNLEHALNEGRDHPWRMEEGFKEKPKIKNKDSDPRVAALEDEFDNVYNSAAAKKRVEDGERKRAELLRRREIEIEERAKRPKTKPPYWKEIINKRPIEPLFDEKSTEAPKTAELRSLFSILSHGLATTLSTTDKPSSRQHSRYWGALNSRETSGEPRTTKWTTRDTETVQQWTKWKSDSIDALKEGETRQWTTPAVDKERLHTILSFMFPYIQKKSEIFEGVLKDKETTTTECVTTVFDPWGDSEEEWSTPVVPDLGKLFRDLNKNATTRHWR
uniref:Uncharacterized protein n=1 Tax=Cacopsylla melanoneura TaxID=428564 RepID=A0A8D8RMW7_9HEMI